MKRTSAILLMLLVFLRLQAQEIPLNEAMTFCLVQADPQSAGMGYAGRASDAGAAWSAFRNPGVTALRQERIDIAGTSLLWGPESAYAKSYAAGAAVRLGRFGLSGAFMQHRCTVDEDLGFAPADHSFGLGAGIAITPSFAAGVSVQNHRSELLPEYTTEASSATMLLTGTLGAFRATAGVTQLGILIQGNKRTPLPASFALAGEWSTSFGPGSSRSGSGTGRGPHSLRLDADLDWFFRSGSLTAALGAEYSFRNVVFLRAGYHLAAGSAPALPSFATLGAGLRINRVRLDFAMLTGNDILGDTLSLGIGFSL